MGDAGRRVMLERGRVLAPQSRDDTREHDRQPVAARVHDARLAQRREQFGAPLDGVLACVHRALEGRGDRTVLLFRFGAGLKARVSGRVRDIGDDLVGHLARDRQDRPLGGVAHGRVGAVGGIGERRSDQRRVDQLAGP